MFFMWQNTYILLITFKVGILSLGSFCITLNHIISTELSHVLELSSAALLGSIMLLPFPPQWQRLKMLRASSQINSPVCDNPLWWNHLLLLEAAGQEGSSVGQGHILLLSHWPGHLICYLGDENIKWEVSEHRKLSRLTLSVVNCM